MPETVIFYTLQTSGTGSSWRILRKLDRKRRIIREIGEERFAKGATYSFDWSELSDEGHLVFANCHYDLRPITNPGTRKFVLNFRDPRDRLCNEYMFNMAHPSRPNEPKEDIEARAAKLREQGIDAWIRKRVYPVPLSDVDYYQYYMRNAERIPPQNRVVNSYARLCLDFDSFVDRACAGLGIEPTDELRDLVENERTAKIERNPAWTGHRMPGSDIMPGRYKYELSPDSIAFLSRHYAPTLRSMAKLDPDYAHLYLENVEDEETNERALPAATSTAPGHSPIPIAGIIRHGIVDRPDLRIEHFRRETNDSEDVVFVLADEAAGGDIELSVAAFLGDGVDVVAISAPARGPIDVPAPDATEIQRWLSWSVRPYRQRLGFLPGNTARGAFTLSKLLQIDRVISLFPLDIRGGHALANLTVIGIVAAIAGVLQRIAPATMLA